MKCIVEFCKEEASTRTRNLCRKHWELQPTYMKFYWAVPEDR